MSLFPVILFAPFLFFLPTVILGLIAHLIWVYRITPDAAPSVLGWLKGVAITFIAFLTPVLSYYANEIFVKNQNRHHYAPSVFLPILVAFIQSSAYFSFTLYIRPRSIELIEDISFFGYCLFFLSIANLTQQMYAHIVFENGRKAYFATAITLTLSSLLWIIPLHFISVIAGTNV